MTLKLIEKDGNLFVRVAGEKQLTFSFFELDKPCRYCRYAEWMYDEKRRFGCGMGQFRLMSKVNQLPDRCGSWKRGEEVMAFVDFSKMREEELKKELEKIRAEKLGIGRKRRVSSYEKRVKQASKGRREVSEDAEWV